MSGGAGSRCRPPPGRLPRSMQARPLPRQAQDPAAGKMFRGWKNSVSRLPTWPMVDDARPPGLSARGAPDLSQLVAPGVLSRCRSSSLSYCPGSRESRTRRPSVSARPRVRSRHGDSATCSVVALMRCRSRRSDHVHQQSSQPQPTSTKVSAGLQLQTWSILLLRLLRRSACPPSDRRRCTSSSGTSSHVAEVHCLP